MQLILGDIDTKGAIILALSYGVLRVCGIISQPNSTFPKLLPQQNADCPEQ